MFGRGVILHFASLLKEGSICISTRHLVSIYHGESTPNLCYFHADAQPASPKNLFPRETSDLIGGVYDSRIKGLLRPTTVGVELSFHAVGKCLKPLRTHCNQPVCTRVRHQTCCTLGMIVAVFRLKLWCCHFFANGVVIFVTGKHVATCTYFDTPHPLLLFSPWGFYFHVSVRRLTRVPVFSFLR